MAKLLFKMRNVPDEEAEEVRALLQENKVDYYETTAGNWGVSMPGLWLRSETDFTRARGLIDEYQQQLHIRLKEQTEENNDTPVPTTLEKFQENPKQFLVNVGLIGLVLFLSLYFFLSLGGN